MMTSSQLETLRVVLESRLMELGTLRRRQDIAIERTADPLDDVVLAGERDFAIWNLDKCFGQVRLVEAALKRIDDGSYGCCVRCDGEIGFKRLTAMPHASFCIKCQEEEEQKGTSLGSDNDGNDLGNIKERDQQGEVTRWAQRLRRTHNTRHSRSRILVSGDEAVSLARPSRERGRLRCGPTIECGSSS